MTQEELKVKAKEIIGIDEIKSITQLPKEEAVLIMDGNKGIHKLGWDWSYEGKLC